MHVLTARAVNEGPKQLKGRKLGDRRVRIERPHAAYFRYSPEGTLIAKEAASAPRTPAGRAFARVRSVLFGRPLSSHEEITERLSKTKALAIFSSDPISSSAYATEEILRVLVLAGAGALFLSLPVAAGVAFLLAAVAISYRQIVHAYPSGGGDYAVARRNLPLLGSLVVAGALLVDYVMTVAVSTASAAEQVISAVPELHDWKLVIGVVAILLITIGNLRGLRESGNIFAIPTYLFVVSALFMIAVGVFRVVVNGEGAAPALEDQGAPDLLVRGRDLPADQGLRVGLGRADRHGGDRERRAGVQAAGVEERGHDARRRRDPARVPVPRDHVRRVVLRRPARRARARPRRPSSARSRP